MSQLTKEQDQILKQILDAQPLIKSITQKINTENGRAILVGGAVRDLLLNKHIKDLDIEVHGLKPEALEKILRSFGHVGLVGKSFGVFRLNGLDIDWSLPRTDSSGRKPTVEIDPFMSIEDAFRRRDLTINSMGIDLISFELIDPFNGQQDLKAGVLRATDKDFFVQDPLRFYRVMQFIGRFQMQPDSELDNICASMNIANISCERIESEFEKLFLKSIKPSLGIKWLDKIGRLQEVLPAVYNIKNVPQNPEWHPEGDVFEHTMQALDAAASFTYDDRHEKLAIVIASLCHDLGKAVTTELRDGKYVSYNHELESEKLSKTLLPKFTGNIDLQKTVLKLVRYHMQPGALISNCAKDPAYKRLAFKLYPQANLEMLAKLFMADRLGRNPKKGEPLPGTDAQVEEFVNICKSLGILHGPEVALLQGKDLINIIEPGPQMGIILDEAYKMQIEDGIKDKEELKKLVLQKFLNGNKT